MLVRRLPFVDGVKTGHTREAGWVLVGAARGQGAQVVSAVLGEPTESARDADSLALLRYGVDQFRRVRVLRAGRRVVRADIEGRSGTVALVPARDVLVSVRRGEHATRQVDAPDEVEGPLPAGRRVGSVKLVYRGKVVRTVPLVTAEAVPRPGITHRLLSGLAVPLTLLAIVVMVLIAARGRARARGRTR
jgi:D-alanyl-D-alanine carboxypeptidase (penicillin-binding protein 5/6)